MTETNSAHGDERYTQAIELPAEGIDLRQIVAVFRANAIWIGVVIAACLMVGVAASVRRAHRPRCRCLWFSPDLAPGAP